jgi:hypothetical protein
LFFAVDAEHDGFDLLFGLEDVRRFGDAFGPGKFGNVHDAFDTGLEFHKRAVRHEVDDFAFDLGVDRCFCSI